MVQNAFTVSPVFIGIGVLIIIGGTVGAITWGISEINKEKLKKRRKGMASTDNINLEQKVQRNYYERLEEYKKLEENCKRVKKEYDLLKEEEKYYEENVVFLNDSFIRVTDSLIYFAACRTVESYEELSTALLNRRRNLCSERTQRQLKKCRELLTSSDFEKYAKQQQEPSLVPVEKAAKSEAEAPTPEDLENAKNDFCERFGNMDNYNEVKDLLEKDIKAYEHDSTQMKKFRVQRRQFWENAYLLSKFLPIIEDIYKMEQAQNEAEAAAEIGTKLIKTVEEHKCIDPKREFLWLFSDSDEYRDSLSVRLDFTLAEADCPGLYRRIGKNEPACVIHGHVVE